MPLFAQFINKNGKLSDSFSVSREFNGTCEVINCNSFSFNQFLCLLRGEMNDCC